MIRVYRNEADGYWHVEHDGETVWRGLVREHAYRFARWGRNALLEPHPSTACPYCDDVPNDSCPLCEGTDVFCPVCRIAAHHCEHQEGREEE